MTAPRRLVVRLDSLGDMLVCGPAIRAAAAGASRLTVLAGPAGAEAARLLPGVDDVLVWRCPWIVADPPDVDHSDVAAVVAAVRAVGADEALILTSFHQSALPTALVLRMAGVPRVAGIGIDYPGSLLDVRVPDPPDAPEPQRMLAVAQAAGYSLPPDDDGRLRVTLSSHPPQPVRGSYLVVHPGVTAPARGYPVESWQGVVAALTAAGWTVVVTGSDAERPLTAEVAAATVGPGRAVDLGGRLDLDAFAHVVQAADAAIVANTGPAHLAAAVGTAVVSLFAPVVPAIRWAPYGVPSAVLGDQEAPCRDTRARVCPVPGHPCLASVRPADVVAAIETLTREVAA